ncbi:hypothetical protein GZ180_10170, partial [Dermatophilus congolensis]
QHTAITAWNNAGHIGVIETVDTDRTPLALAAITDALREGLRTVLITPSDALANQWHQRIHHAYPQLTLGDTTTPNAHVTITTATNLATHNPLNPNEAALLIADEVHRYATDDTTPALTPQYIRRLGLTAEYKRGDTGDAQHLWPYFRHVVHRLGYRDALNNNLITPYRIARIGIHLTPEEHTQYTHAIQQLHTTTTDLITHHGARPNTNLHAYATTLTTQPDHPGHASATTYLNTLTNIRTTLTTAQAKLDVITALAPIITSQDDLIIFTEGTETTPRITQALTTIHPHSLAIHTANPGDSNIQRTTLHAPPEANTTTETIYEGITSPTANIGIVLSPTRSKRQMTRRLACLVTPNTNQRTARGIVLYALETIEDTPQQHAVYNEMLRNAQATEQFTFPAGLAAAREFLTP